MAAAQRSMNPSRQSLGVKGRAVVPPCDASQRDHAAHASAGVVRTPVRDACSAKCRASAPPATHPAERWRAEMCEATSTAKMSPPVLGDIGDTPKGECLQMSPSGDTQFFQHVSNVSPNVSANVSLFRGAAIHTREADMPTRRRPTRASDARRNAFCLAFSSAPGMARS